MAQKTFKLKVSKNTRVIKHKEKAIVYNAFYGDGMVCHIDMLELIDNIKQGKSIQELKKQYQQLNIGTSISELMKKGLVVEKNILEANRPYRVYSDAEIESGCLINKLRLNVSHACNMRCAYCYVDKKDAGNIDATMTWNTAKKAINKFFNLLKQHSHKFCIIRFFGGEPLLNWPVIRQSLEYIQKESHGISVSFLLNTNGTIFTEEIAKTLSIQKIGLAISLDGTSKEHDLVRQFKSGKPSYEVIVRHIENFLRAGCILGIETTIGDHNIFRLKGLIDQIALWNTTFKVSIPLSFQHLAIVDKTKIDTIPVKEKTKQIIALIESAGKKNVRADTGMVHFSINALKGQRNTGRYCRAMGGELCVYPNGDIYPCGALKIKLGAIDDIMSVFRSIAYHSLANRTAGNIPACRGCEIEAFCAGGCAADVFAVSGVVNTRMINCDLERKLFKNLVKRDVLAFTKFSIKTGGGAYGCGIPVTVF
ncbi:MAG: radical SAM protein [Proteobacteria bacterium]|nr:radical SAM protein [Pseudomonadota bacterium]MBU1585702.1 radical SAM protein [Pseudomonadota bacterium]MBU2454120.1 radical SAM protein [Pseudomonadota bacterium]MBU2629205.1 radical SAM protein [Pseudomonadota bacterium]